MLASVFFKTLARFGCFFSFTVPPLLVRTLLVVVEENSAALLYCDCCSVVKCYHHVSCGIHSFFLFTTNGCGLPFGGCNGYHPEFARTSHSLWTSTDNMDTEARTKWHEWQAPVYNVWVCDSKLIHLLACYMHYNHARLCCRNILAWISAWRNHPAFL